MKSIRLSASALLLAGTALPAWAQEIRMWTLDDGIAPFIEAFEAENPGMTVEYEIVPYQTVLDSLPVQWAAGEGPDVSLTTDFGGLSKFYLDLTPYVDAEYFEKEFGPTLAWLRGDNQDSTAIYGVVDSMTVNGGYVNLTLFEQAGVEVPGEGATWEDWAVAAKKVSEATGTDYPMAMDRSGHRFASLAISYGAEMTVDGKPVLDDGFKDALETFVEWHKDGTMPMDLWGAVGGAKTIDQFDDFVNAKTPFYFGGSWTLRRMDEEVGELFDWKVVETPCGPSSCTAMPGGGALVGFKDTKHPEVVGKFLSFLAREDNMRQMVINAVNVPAARSLVESGVTYPGISARVQEGLDTFTRQIPKMAPAAYDFQGWRFQRAMMNAETTRISQVLTGELDVETALARIKEDVELAIEAAQ